MARERRSMQGKVIAVTGAGHGIGREIAATLSRAGAHVALGDIDVAAAEQARAGLYGEHVALAVDVTDRASFIAFLDAAEERLGPLGVLVNNAGIAAAAPYEEQDPDLVRAMIDVNLMGPLTGTQLAVERMLPRGHGHVVNVSSLAGKAGAPGLVAYAASKHGVVGLTDTLRAELWGRGLDFTTVMPGPVDTDMMAGTTSVPMVRLVTPQQVAEGVLRALQTGATDVYVPVSLGAITTVANLLPEGARIRLNRALGVHRIYTELDPAARAAYDARMGRAAPGA